MFLLMSLVGIMILYVAPMFLVATPSLANCSAMLWLANLGFTITFAPLFAKTWRIYRIFGMRKLSITKISNRQLAAIVGAIVGIDVILMIIWQAMNPLQPGVTLQLQGSTTYSYTQCMLPSGSGTSGVAIVAVVVATKGAMILFGCIMSFSTRKVSTNFNESQNIAWAIYNVIGACGIIAPIIAAVNAVGTTLIILEVFLVLWICSFTLAILYVPKLVVLFSSAVSC